MDRPPKRAVGAVGADLFHKVPDDDTRTNVGVRSPGSYEFDRARCIQRSDNG
jgi:hypothetical protein